MQTNCKKNTKFIIIKICLLLLVGMFCISVPVVAHAESVEDTSASDLLNAILGTGDDTATDALTSTEGTENTTDGDTNSSLSINIANESGGLAGALRILLTLTLIALAPTLVICLTSFTRIIIVLHFTRSALNTQSAPPNQVLLGLALFLTFFIMSPVITQINENAFQPFEAGEITQEVALERGIEPIREFMYGQTQTKDVRLFLEISNVEWDGTMEGIPTSVLIPSFMISELRSAFIIGFIIYIPFIIIDMVVASVLMSMGMMMLPPTTISMPFKILLFILADGWGLVIGNVVKSFY